MEHSQLIDKYFELEAKFINETDRGMSVLVCSYLDELLECVIKKQMRKSKIANNLFKGYGPISTFSAKIDICYSLGNFDNFQYNEFSIIRKIRNRFAHEFDGVSFECEKVKQMCSNLGFCEDIGVYHPEINTARKKYIYSISCLVCEVDILLQKISEGQSYNKVLK